MRSGPTFRFPCPLPIEENEAVDELEAFLRLLKGRSNHDDRVSIDHFLFLYREAKSCWIRLWVEMRLRGSRQHTSDTCADLLSWCQLMQRVIVESENTQRDHDVWLDGQRQDSSEVIRLYLPHVFSPVLPPADKKCEAWERDPRLGQFYGESPLDWDSWVNTILRLEFRPYSGERVAIDFPRLIGTAWDQMRVLPGHLRPLEPESVDDKTTAMRALDLVVRWCEEQILGKRLHSEATATDSAAKSQSPPLAVVETGEASTTERGTKIAMALGMLAIHPDWTNNQIADAVDCHPKYLSQSDKFKAARKVIKGIGQETQLKSKGNKGREMDEYNSESG